MENVFNILEERGYIEQMTHPKEMKELFSKESVAFYIGIDPTADSLHVGHFVSLMVASHMQKCGHKPIILVGGGTASIGDPSGKTDMRKMLSREDINHNVECLKKQIEKFVSFEGENAAIIVNNADWLLDFKFVDFMREIGSLFSVNKMLAAECYKQRLETGLTFFEMSYMLMQSYDFLHLYNTYGCKLEIGGNDQWSNIIGGVDLIRKIGKDDSFGLTFKLLTTKEGKKMGKTQSGAVWLDPEKTSPFDFYQYWRNVSDDDVLKCLRMLTFLPLEQIDEMDKWEGSQLNQAKEILAFELTKMVHGEEEAAKAQEGARALFSSGNAAQMPEVELTDADFEDGQIGILNLLVKAGLAPSNGEARRNVQQGGVSIDGNKVEDVRAQISKDSIGEDGIVLKRGKKKFMKIVVR